jgi:hypothetical protein
MYSKYSYRTQCYKGEEVNMGRGGGVKVGRDE